MMKRILLLSALSATVNAAIYPIPQPYDYRVTVAQYNPENVINVRTKVGTSTLIQFEEGESIPELGKGIGDVAAWGIVTHENNLFLKPIVAIDPDTNLTIVTNKNRTYSFWLETSDFPHFIVKMAYGKPKTAEDFKRYVPCSDGPMNFDYQMWGEASLAPNYMWDDGRFTCLKFTTQTELPVAYQVGRDGTESLINYHMEKDTMILQGIAPEFRLRLGEQVLGLKSEHIQPEGFNQKATSVDATRVIKNNE